MATLRELKGRIGSVASSEKITGAMKMISSAKMHRAEGALRRLQPFRRQIETILGDLLSTDAVFDSPLTQVRETVHSVTLVVFGSDDGLCGAYNINIYKAVVAKIADYRKLLGDKVQIRLITVGGKINKACSKLQSPTIEVGPLGEANSKTEGEGVKNFSQSLIHLFTSGETDQVDMLYMNFLSVSRQRCRLDQLMPVKAEAFLSEKPKALNQPCIFEPNPEAIFQSILPMFLLSVMQDVFTENRASEQAARIMAMQSANDNAKKLLEELRLEYNKLRQAAITSELLDIIGGQAR